MTKQTRENDSEIYKGFVYKYHSILHAQVHSKALREV